MVARDASSSEGLRPLPRAAAAMAPAELPARKAASIPASSSAAATPRWAHMPKKELLSARAKGPCESHSRSVHDMRRRPFQATSLRFCDGTVPGKRNRSRQYRHATTEFRKWHFDLGILTWE
eukprot:scaffold5013_cov273-Pinguiococcus_pyrenoidosus.AAC.8